MLILGRRVGQSIVLDGNIRITIVDVRNDYIRLGIEAPRNVSIYREEVLEQLNELNRDAAAIDSSDVALVPQALRRSTFDQQGRRGLQAVHSEPDA